MSGRKKKILLLHGCGPKPVEDELHQVWRDALLEGLKRDESKLKDKFADVDSEFFHYAENFEPFMEPEFDPSLDMENRRLALRELVNLEKAREFRRRNYDALPGKSAAKEFLMDAGASVGLGGLLVKKKLPELHDYLSGGAWGEQVRVRLQESLERSLAEGEDVLVIGHCLGSVIGFDALWSLSREKELLDRVSVFVSMGSPLSDRSVQGRLQGSSKNGVERYPNNISRWYNLSAEDDYVCHDKTVRDDFKAMLDHRMVSEIEDFTIYNLAVRYGRSNAHSSVGYLVHPRMAKILADWIRA
ncbi:MAG: hypothetical protein GKR90_16330 [Pseudomonadales bacterium]|nr:hypothetical protein [Pseudomonadales bacterium]